MVDALVILDGASEPPGPVPTSLERARTPVLDGLAAEGVVTRLRTVPAGLPAGSETAIPALLGWTPGAPVDRGALEAAARDIAVPDGERAWRVDVLDDGGGRAGEAEAVVAAAELARRAPRHSVRHLSGHRLLVCGATPPPAAPGLRTWPPGAVPPPVLDPSTIVVAAPGAAAGAARLMGARVVVPDGATGGTDTDMAAKATDAAAAIAAGASRVVVHVGAPDEAAHGRDADAKVAAIERADRELVAPVAEAVRAAGGRLRVCPDHGCDPRTGEHDGSPVPCLVWGAGTGAAAGAGGRTRLTERAPREAAA